MLGSFVEQVFNLLGSRQVENLPHERGRAKN